MGDVSDTGVVISEMIRLRCPIRQEVFRNGGTSDNLSDELKKSRNSGQERTQAAFFKFKFAA
jgi:hypothetical protein